MVSVKCWGEVTFLQTLDAGFNTKIQENKKFFGNRVGQDRKGQQLLLISISFLCIQLILTGGAVIAGEYEVILPGIYGDDLPLPESNRELLPLLQRLIRLLEEGMPVLMNSAGQVVGGGYAVLGGGAKFDVISAGGAAAGSSGADRVTALGM